MPLKPAEKAMLEYTNDYLLNQKVKIFQPTNGYRASTDAVLLAAFPQKIKSGDRFLDIGSGTGAISLCLAHRLQEQNIKIYGFELQSELTELANMSATANNFSHFLHYHNTDISQPNIPEPTNSFQHVITNPPYSKDDMKSPNLSKSLAHNFSATDLKSWIHFCLKMLAPYGYFYMINRAEALPQILTFLQDKAGEINIIPLYSKSQQNAKRVIVTARKNSKAPAIIHPPFIIHNDDSSYTTKAEQILRLGKTFWQAND